VPERENIAELIPHQAAMCLLERLIEWDDQHVVLATTTHRSVDNPLRMNGRLRALHLCEYGAQAMAVHGGLRARAAGGNAQPGLLVSLRDVRLGIDFAERLAGELTVTAHRLLGSLGSWQYSFEISHEQKPLATGRAAIIARTPL
jgi:predicted hotdog family 3-hydroxylacyl-ACP dehydratase